MDRKHQLVTLFSIGYGSFLLLLYIAEAYSVLWRNEFLEFVPLGPGRRAPSPEPVAMLLSPFAILLLFTALSFLGVGLYLWGLGNAKTRAVARNAAYSALLTDDEKAVFEKLRDAGGALTQKELSNVTGFSAVKIHRVLARLKSKNVVSMHAFGMTNRIVLADGDKQAQD